MWPACAVPSFQGGDNDPKEPRKDCGPGVRARRHGRGRPAGNKAVEGFAVAGIEKNLQLYGEAWCRGHAKLLYDQLACIERTFGLSGMG